MGAPNHPAPVSLRRVLSANVERLQRLTFLVAIRSENGEKRDAESKLVFVTGNPLDFAAVDIFGGRCELYGVVEIGVPRHG